MNAAERTVAGALLVAMIASVLFVVFYASGGNRLGEGLTLTFAAAGFCGAAIGWAFGILPDEQVEDHRDDYPSARRDRIAADVEAREGAEQLSRSNVLVRLLLGALGVFGIALVTPIASLGPVPDDTLFHTKWRRGLRLSRTDGTFVRAGDLNVDSVVTVFPEGAVGDAQSQASLIRVPDGIGGSVQGYMAYSRVCTHAGCPVALYRASARELMCPCHQSMFSVVNDGAVVSGPADHALPRLPLEIDAQGFLRATGDFPVPIGPGFWGRGSGAT